MLSLKSEAERAELLTSDFGIRLQQDVSSLDSVIGSDEELVKEYLAKLSVYQNAILHFYGIRYVFTRTDEYFGLVTEDESDFLFIVMREL